MASGKSRFIRHKAIRLTTTAIEAKTANYLHPSLEFTAAQFGEALAPFEESLSRKVAKAVPSVSQELVQ